MPQAQARTETTMTKPAMTIPVNYKAHTRFGEIILAQDKLLSFPQGIFGFEDYTQFGLSNVPGQPESPLLLLHCLNTPEGKPEATFVVGAPAILGLTFAAGDLEAAIAENNMNPTETQALVILTIYPLPDGGVSITANLRAPILVDTASRTGLQHILANAAYSTQHKVA